MDSFTSMQDIFLSSSSTDKDQWPDHVAYVSRSPSQEHAGSALPRDSEAIGAADGSAFCVIS
uniref:Pheromone n=1 Tax=Lentinula edodes TaxID=5353 RepID=A0A2U9Q1F2_LENED|nr:Pheromone [Lentinula edodes]AWT58024.1 Pheromone [Lentinula edodes]AWT58059.1 Pheromone [Lentinula edodes]AWT58065.1 Pheromone [Lentinula edodes]